MQKPTHATRPTSTSSRAASHACAARTSAIIPSVVSVLSSGMSTSHWSVSASKAGDTRWNISGAIATNPRAAHRAHTLRICALTPNASWITSIPGCVPLGGPGPSGWAT